mmetsp:Transcript_23075/g.59284  ORF Transcript_23075/g.59284 Transcript_23075/m.59284 type:complete len:146 (-) Transcript_23075:230-667(-)
MQHRPPAPSLGSSAPELLLAGELGCGSHWAGLGQPAPSSVISKQGPAGSTTRGGPAGLPVDGAAGWCGCVCGEHSMMANDVAAITASAANAPMHATTRTLTRRSIFELRAPAPAALFASPEGGACTIVPPAAAPSACDAFLNRRM